jgi:hypothetical protein
MKKGKGGRGGLYMGGEGELANGHGVRSVRVPKRTVIWNLEVGKWELANGRRVRSVGVPKRTAIREQGFQERVILLLSSV